MKLPLFNILEKQFIEIILVEEKDEIYNFDEVKIIYNKDNLKYVLFYDFICEGLKVFINIMQKSLNKELQIQESFLEKGIGYKWNSICHNLFNNMSIETEDITESHHLWSTTSKDANETWLYNIGENIYLEISPTFVWNYDDMSFGEQQENYKHFLDSYKPYDCVMLEKRVAEQWLKECTNLLNSLLQ